MLMIFDKAEDIPEALRASAKEVEGKFHLEGDGLVSKNKELLEELGKYKGIAKQLDGLDVPAAKKALADMSTLEARRAEMDTEIRKAVEVSSQSWQQKVNAEKEVATKFKSALENRIVDSELDSAIRGADGNPLFVLPHLRNSVRVVEENGQFVAKIVDAKGQPRLTDNGEAFTAKHLVEETKANSLFKDAFKAPPASGSGATGGGQRSGNGGVVTLTREQAKDNRAYRQALETVKGDISKIQFTE